MAREEIEKLNDREKDAVIAKWLGLFNGYTVEGLIAAGCSMMGVDYYSTSTAAAIHLLPGLVKRGYATQLICDNPISDEWYFGLRKGAQIVSATAPTISAAIVNAILQLPEVRL